MVQYFPPRETLFFSSGQPGKGRKDPVSQARKSNLNVINRVEDPIPSKKKPTKQIFFAEFSLPISLTRIHAGAYLTQESAKFPGKNSCFEIPTRYSGTETGKTV
jgi:hypothetical protein